MLDWSDGQLQAHTCLATPHKKQVRTPSSSSLDVATPRPIQRESPKSGIKVAGGQWDTHERTHAAGAGKCNKCCYARNRRNWFPLTPLGGKADVCTTWLCARPVDVPDSEWGVGCKACSWAAKSVPSAAEECSAGPYINVSVCGASLRLANLRRHAAWHPHSTRSLSRHTCNANLQVVLLPCQCLDQHRPWRHSKMHGLA